MLKKSLIAAACAVLTLSCGLATAQDYESIPVDSQRAEQREAVKGEAVQLETVIVEGQFDTRYDNSQASSGTKTDTALIDTAQSISVISREQLDDLGSLTLQEALRYSAGVRSDAYGLDSRVDSVFVRGASPIQYVDGLRQLFGYYNNTRPDPYVLERIEVVKGPASVLYGQGTTGGIVALTSKRPQADGAGELRLEYGEYDRRQVSFDGTGGIAGDQLMARLVALKRESDTQVDYVSDDRWVLAPSITFAPSDTFKWTLLGNFQKDNGGATTAFLPWSGTIYDNPNGKIPTSRFTSEPDFDRYDTEQKSVTSLIEWQLNDALTLRQNLRYSDSSADYRTLFPNVYVNLDPTDPHNPYFPDPQQRRVLRIATITESDAKAWLSDHQAHLRWSFAGVEHQLLVGVEALGSKIDEVYGQSSVAQIAAQLLTGGFDLYDPVYGRPFAVPATAARPRQTVQQTGVYFQDQLRFGDGWVGTLGVRRDWAETEQNDVRNRDAQTSLRAGLLYHAAIGLAPYVSYSESFQPTPGAGEPAQGQTVGAPFEPQLGRQWEAGLRYELPGGMGLLSLAAFDIEEKNRLSPGSNPAYNIQLGESRIKGAEFEAQTTLFRTLDLIASLTWLDAGSFEDVPDADTGETVREESKLASVPERMASLWARWRFSIFGLPGFSVGAGARHTGGTTDESGSIEIPEVTLFDAMASWESRHWRVQVNGSNLEDETVIATCLERGDCFYGARRNVVGSLTYRF